jgi:hypothetical protein
MHFRVNPLHQGWQLNIFPIEYRPLHLEAIFLLIVHVLFRDLLQRARELDHIVQVRTYFFLSVRSSFDWLSQNFGGTGDDIGVSLVVGLVDGHLIPVGELSALRHILRDFELTQGSLIREFWGDLLCLGRRFVMFLDFKLELDLLEKVLRKLCTNDFDACFA